jgi:type I site-specific restriction endonuclease
MNQTPEEIARDLIDSALQRSGWSVQKKDYINLAASVGVAVREYSTEVGPADFVLFVDKTPVGVIEAKRAEEGVRLTTVEDQSSEYATSKLKYLQNDPLPFVYESTGDVTRFTDYRDPNRVPVPSSPSTSPKHFVNGSSSQRLSGADCTMYPHYKHADCETAKSGPSTILTFRSSRTSLRRCSKWRRVPARRIPQSRLSIGF